MFRASRNVKYKEQSLFIIPYLNKILVQQPTDHWINKFERVPRNDFEFCQYEFVFSYKEIKGNNSSDKFNVIIKILEEIGYPKDWKNEPLMSQQVIRRVVFLSCSLKKV